MNLLAWLLLAVCVIGLIMGVLEARATRPTRCECGEFKLPRADRCFTCDNR